MSGDPPRAPPRAPRRTLIRDSASRMRNASRSVGRDTPNISISTVSGGSESPVFSSPRTTCPRMYEAISSAVLGARRADPTGSRLESTGARPQQVTVESTLPALEGGMAWALLEQRGEAGGQVPGGEDLAGLARGHGVRGGHAVVARDLQQPLADRGGGGRACG